MFRHHRSGFALFAAMGFLAVMFIVITAANTSFLDRIAQDKRVERRRQALDISRAVAIGYLKNGETPAMLSGYECTVEALSTTDPVASTAPTQSSQSAVTVQVRKGQSGLLTRWNMPAGQASIVMLEQREI